MKLKFFQKYTINWAFLGNFGEFKPLGLSFLINFFTIFHEKITIFY